MMKRESGVQTDAPVEPMQEGDLSDKEIDRPKLLVDETQSKKYKSLRIRTISTVALIGGYLVVVWAGHVPLMFLLFAMQVGVVREFFAIARVPHQDRRLPGFRAQQWYFFLIADFFLLGRLIRSNVLVEVTSTRLLAKLFSWVMRRHTMVSYAMYLAGFVSFVLSLKKGMYLYQFSQFAWTHTIILIVVVPSSFIVSNVFAGIIWWMLPSMLVICNDICAYLAGFFFGRTPLISLSPKKTWEGFLGGALGTVVLAFVLATVLARSKWMVCPRKDLSLFGKLDCALDDIYQHRLYSWADLDEYVPDPVIDKLVQAVGRLPPQLGQAVRSLSFTAMPIQVHAMFLALFASIIAPFGGFCASGFKRAFKMKDFGDTIPGHGGVTDRFDCQLLMAVFMYVYYWTYISKPELSVGEVLGTAMRLGDMQQLELFAKLGNMMVGEGLLPDSIMELLSPIINSNYSTQQLSSRH
ncbi:phosphatidate cytidylyltransferase [Haematococcus lacustris]